MVFFKYIFAYLYSVILCISMVRAYQGAHTKCFEGLLLSSLRHFGTTDIFCIIPPWIINRFFTPFLKLQATIQKWLSDPSNVSVVTPKHGNFATITHLSNTFETNHVHFLYCIFPQLLVSSFQNTPCIFKESALWADSFYKSKCPYVCLCVCLFVCPSHFLTPFNGLFAPTSQSPMSKLFRFSEFLGEK